jgi:hypothetical protein
MSVDIALMLPIPDTTSSEEDKGEFFRPMGSRKDVISTLATVCYRIEFPDSATPNQGILQGISEVEGKDYFIEFELWEEDGLVHSIDTGSSRWSGNDVIEIIHQITQATGWRVFDLISGEFINIQTGQEETGWRLPGSEEPDWDDPTIQANLEALREKLRQINPELFT